MKAYTDLNQSKKLAEILPLESADAAYQRLPNGKHASVPCIIVIPYVYITDIPCWSLAALLDIMPDKLQIVLAINDSNGDRKEKYAIGSVENDTYDCYADNPVDACYEMIIKLHEQKLL